MDAFESLIEMLLKRQGYWTRTSLKVDLTRKEKQAILHVLPRRRHAKAFLRQLGTHGRSFRRSAGRHSGRHFLVGSWSEPSPN